MASNAQVHGASTPFCIMGANILMKESKTDEALGRLSGISCSISFTSCVISRGANPVDWIFIHKFLSIAKSDLTLQA